MDEAPPRSNWPRDAVHLLVGTTLGLSIGLCFWHFGRRADDEDVRDYARVREFVERQYVRELTREELLDAALGGMVESLDPYSRYYGPDEVAAVERETTGHYQGIGVVFAQPTSEARVLYTLPGSPAEKAGLRVGDQILRCAGREVPGLAAGELRKLLGDRDRGPVELALRARDGSERSVKIGQDALVDPTVRHVRQLGGGVGYLAITAFSQETPNEFDASVEELRAGGLAALVLDLRGNLGGVLRSATRIANRFVEHGLIVSHEGRTEAQRYEAEPDEATLKGLPLVVLVDGESASASEVLAAAVQEHRAAVLVGSPTYGKGLVQKVETFDGGTRVVKLVSAYYYTPSHRNLERTVEGAWTHGLLPDVQVDTSKAELEALRQFLASYSPPKSALAELEAWEAEAKRPLYPRPPQDPQLEAALALLRGEHPCATVAR